MRVPRLPFYAVQAGQKDNELALTLWGQRTFFTVDYPITK